MPSLSRSSLRAAFRQTDDGQGFIGRGGTKDTFTKHEDRGRLKQHGDDVAIANAEDLRDHRGCHAVCGGRASLANFGNLVNGQVTREQAVGQLLDDLLIG